MSSALTRSTSLNLGWTWVSLNLQPSDLSVAAIFGALPLSLGDQVKSQFSFTDFYGEYGFFGQLTTLTTDTMYAIKLATPGTIEISGLPVSLPKTVTLATNGWAWLPCPYQSAVPLASGAPAFNYLPGDSFKSQLAFSDYYEVTLHLLPPSLAVNFHCACCAASLAFWCLLC